MPKRLALLCVLSLALSTIASAQGAGDFVRTFGGIVQQAMRQAAQLEWLKLSASDRTCLDLGLRAQGDSMDALINRGVLPSDPSLVQLRSTCRPTTNQNSQEANTQPSPYVVDGLALGARVIVESDAYKQYQCAPSEKFAGFMWCHKEEKKTENRNEITYANSILHAQDGTAWYVNRYIEPAFFSPKDVKTEIDRLSAIYGERAREIQMPQRDGLPNAVIAIWGNIRLDQLAVSDVSTLASGGGHRGILVSFLGDLQRSAKAGVPVYRLQGGSGFLWAATFNQNGRGALRFLTIDASKIAQSAQDTLSLGASAPFQRPPDTALQSDKGTMAPEKIGAPAKELTRLLEVPNSCLAARQAVRSDPRLRLPRAEGVPSCIQMIDCLRTLPSQTQALIAYLSVHPLLIAELRSRSQNFNYALQQLEFVAKRSGGSFSCYSVYQQLNQSVFALAEGGSTWSHAFETFVVLARSFLTSMQADYQSDLVRYSDWAPYAKHYDRRSNLAGLKEQYALAYESDPDSFLRLRPTFLQRLSDAEQFKETLLSQTDELTLIATNASDLLQQASQEPLSKMISPEVVALGIQLRTDVVKLRETPPTDRGDARNEIVDFSKRMTDLKNKFDLEQAKVDELNSAIDALRSAADQASKLASNEELGEFIDDRTKTSAHSLVDRATALSSLDLWVLKDKKEELRVAIQELLPIVRELEVDKAKYDAAKTLDSRRKSITESAANNLAYFERPEIRTKLSRNGKSEITTLVAETDSLSKIAAIRLSDRGDYSGKLAAAEEALAKVGKDKRQVESLDRLREDMMTLNDKIERRGHDLLDAQTSSELANADASFRSFTAGGVPLSDEELGKVETAVRTMLGKIDDVLDRAAYRKAILRKGQEYASAGESYWKLVSEKNEMTDRIDVSAVSVQRNESGVFAQVKGYCTTDNTSGTVVAFTALIVDKDGNPTIDIPQSQSVLGVSANIRINEYQPEKSLLHALDNFRNELLLVTLATDPHVRIPLVDIWRIYVQFNTSRQQMIIKIPMYDDTIQEMIKSCRS